MTRPPGALAGMLDEGSSVSIAPASGAGRRLRRLTRSAMGVAGGAVTAAFLLAALLAPAIAPHDPLAQDLAQRLAPPDGAHWLGRDEFGRDLLSRVLWGARLSLGLGAGATLLAVLAGVPLGLAAGYAGGRLDAWIMRGVDVLLAFPGILLALAVVAVAGSGAPSLVAAIAVFSLPTFARLARASALALRATEFVEAAHALGAHARRILLRHVLPNALGPIVVQSTLAVAGAILTASALSFLGVGVPAPTPEWGAMISDGRAYLRVAPHLVAVPGLALALVTFGLNALGDALRDVLDPRG